MILPQSIFYGLLVVMALVQLVLVGRLWLTRFAVEAWRIASLGFFLCALAVIALWFLTRGQTSPPFGNIFLVLLFMSMLADASCLLSMVCGVFCLSTRPWVLLWLVPASLLLAALSVGMWRVFR